MITPLIVLAGCLTLAATAGTAAMLLRPSAITEQEALQTFAAIRTGVADEEGRPDPDSFCADFASDQTMCAWSLGRAGATYPIGEVELHSVQLLRDGTAVIRVEGKLSDHGLYSGFIQIVRENGTIVAADPVFWVTREFTETSNATPSPAD